MAPDSLWGGDSVNSLRELQDIGFRARYGSCLGCVGQEVGIGQGLLVTRPL